MLIFVVSKMVMINSEIIIESFCVNVLCIDFISFYNFVIKIMFICNG